MAKQTAGFVDLHIEKVVVGSCAFLLLATVGYYFVFGNPFAVDGKGASTLAEALQSEAAAVAVKVRGNPFKPQTNVDEELAPVRDKFKMWFGPDAPGLVDVAKIEGTLPRLGRYTTLHLVDDKTDEDRIDLAQLVAPSAPAVTTGHTSMFIPDPRPLKALVGKQVAKTPEGETATRNWVSVAAVIDLTQQQQNFVAADYQPGMMTLPIVRVRLQRKDADDRDASWENVATYSEMGPIPLPPLEFEPNGHLTSSSAKAVKGHRGAIEAAWEFIEVPFLPEAAEDSKSVVARPRLPYLAENQAQSEIPDDVPVLPADDTADAAGARVREWRQEAAKADDLNAAYLLANAAVRTTKTKKTEAEKAKAAFADVTRKMKNQRPPIAEPRDPERLMPIVANDLTAVPGRRYYYRIGYEILNLMVGEPESLKNPADARQFTLASGWSEQSRAVEVESDLYYYLVEIDTRNPRAKFDVYRVLKSGSPDHEDYWVNVGDYIGEKKKVDFSTGKILLDVTQGGVVVVDAADGSLELRELAADRASRKHTDLKKKSRRVATRG